MPPLDEGDLLYMPSALPGSRPARRRELLQQTDRLIKTVPEVATRVRQGRAAPRPRPIRRRWRCSRPRSSSSRATSGAPGMTPDKLVEELDRAVKVPGLSNIWVPPIRNRIDMLATGIKSPVGVKVAGADLAEIDRIAAEIERVVKDVPGVTSALAERLTGGRYIDVRDRSRRRRRATGSTSPTCRASSRRRSAATTSARPSRGCSASRSTCAIRASCATRSRSCASCRSLTERGAQIRLGDVAAHRASPTGRRCCSSENARLSGWVYVDVRGRDLRSAVRDMQRGGRAARCKLPPGYSIVVVGAVRVPRARDAASSKVVVPATLADHLRAALPDLPPLRRRAADHGDAAVRAGRRLLAAVPAGLQHVGRDGRRLHRAGRRRGGVRRRDAGLPQAGDGRARRRTASSATRAS